MEIKAFLADAQGHAQIQTVELDAPKAGEVLIKTVATGICHTDIAGRDLGMSPYPVALGHEGTGVIEALGDGVEGLAVGDKVIVSFPYCGHCAQCLSGHPAQCDHLNEYAFNGNLHDGTYRLHTEDGQDVASFFGQASLATHMVVDQHNLVKVPAETDLRQLGPLGCGFLTGAGTVINGVKPEFGSTMVIAGAGGVGLAALMAANLYNLDHLIIIDRNNPKLELAKELGATDVINPKEVDDVEAAIREIVPGGVDYAIDTTGYTPLFKAQLHALTFGGKLFMLGVTGDLDISGMEVMGEGKQIIGLIEGDSVPQILIPKLMNYYHKGKFPLDKLSAMYQFDDIEQAFADFEAGKIIKPIITFE